MGGSRWFCSEGIYHGASVTCLERHHKVVGCNLHITQAKTHTWHRLKPAHSVCLNLCMIHTQICTEDIHRSEHTTCSKQIQKAC